MVSICIYVCNGDGTLDVKELCHATAVRRLTACPIVIRRRAITILAVDIDAVLGDQRRNLTLHPLLCRRDAVVEQALL